MMNERVRLKVVFGDFYDNPMLTSFPLGYVSQDCTGVIKSCYRPTLSSDSVSFSSNLPATMPEEASDFALATVKRLKLDKLTDEKKSLKDVLERRDNDEVVEHLKAAGDKKEENYRVFSFFKNLIFTF